MGAGREKSDALIADELAHTAHNYHALPVVFERAQGAVVTDVDGKGAPLSRLYPQSVLGQQAD